jgi:hypothetical protein
MARIYGAQNLKDTLVDEAEAEHVYDNIAYYQWHSPGPVSVPVGHIHTSSVRDSPVANVDTRPVR